MQQGSHWEGQRVICMVPPSTHSQNHAAVSPNCQGGWENLTSDKAGGPWKLVATLLRLPGAGLVPQPPGLDSQRMAVTEFRHN